jgi:carboxylesterase
MHIPRGPRLAIALTLLLAGCASRPDPHQYDLDSGAHPYAPAPLSQTHPHPTEAERNRPVLLAAHGFSATVWDFDPLIAAMHQRGIAISPVTLGGHGASTAAFAQSDWRTWQAPMLAEYKALRAQGYRHITVLGHSTGATLWLRALEDGTLGPVPARMIFVSPLIEFATFPRAIYFAGLLPWVGVNQVERRLTGGSMGHIYSVRPVSALQTLTDLTVSTRLRLSHGLPLPAASRVLVVQGDRDGVVDPAGARMLVDHLVGPTPRLMMVPSEMHNPMGPDGMEGHTFTPDEAAVRDRILAAIADHVTAE